MLAIGLAFRVPREIVYRIKQAYSIAIEIGGQTFEVGAPAGKLVAEKSAQEGFQPWAE